jgi:DNA-binding LacI/PurR family transcriptional regulator
MHGYEQALAEAGIPVDPALIGYVGQWHRLDGAQCMRELLASGVEFDAVFGLNDALALGAVRVLQEAGLRIPADVAVIGFDGLDETQYSLPALSTVDPGRDEIAETAVRVLMERIASRGAAFEPQTYLADFRVVERESTAS